MNTEFDSMLFKDVNWTIHSPKIKLTDILSSDRVEWLAILVDGYLVISDRNVNIRSFDELETLQRRFGLPSLGEIRAEGKLIEGERVLPMWLIESLCECSGGTVRIRASGTNIADSIDLIRFASIMSSEQCEDEIEASSTDGAWYLRMRNDDALIFIAAPGIIAKKIRSSSSANVRLMSGDFVFTP